MKNYNKQELTNKISSKIFTKILGSYDLDYYLVGEAEFKKHFANELENKKIFNQIFDYVNAYNKNIAEEFIEALSCEIAYLLRKQTKFNKLIKNNYEDSLYSEIEKSYLEDAVSASGKVIKGVLNFVGFKWETRSYVENNYLMPTKYSKIAFNPRLKLCQLHLDKIDIDLILAESRLIKLLKIISYYNVELEEIDEQTLKLKLKIEEFLPSSLSLLNEYNKQICCKMTIDEINKNISVALLRLIEIVTYKAYLSQEDLEEEKPENDFLLIKF